MNSSLNRQYYIGIDPGATGAIAMIDKQLNILRLNDWPGDEIQAAACIREIISAHDSENIEIFAAIERVNAMPKQGVTSTFKFGANYGIWKGILAAFQISFIEVRPQAWQKGVISKAQDKKPAVAAAGRLFPKAQLFGPRGGAKDGRADALLIAYWCMMQHSTKERGLR